MKKSIGASAITVLSVVMVIATARADWQKTYTGNGVAQALSVQPTSDGGYILAGHTAVNGEGNADVLLIKTDATGNQTWSRTFGSSGIDRAYSVQPTADGGYVLAGATQPAGRADLDFYLIKTDAAGHLQWLRTFGDSGDDVCYAVIQTGDGGYLLAGGRQKVPVTGDLTDACLIKTDHLGNEAWSKTFDAHPREHFADVLQAAQGGYVAVGAADDGGTAYVYVVKSDTAGTTTWSRTFAGSRYDFAQTINQTSDGGFFISATTDDLRARIIKTDGSGSPAWSRVFSVINALVATCRAAIQTLDGGYALVGTIAETSTDLSACANGSAGDTDTYLLKTDAAGNETWRRIYDTDDCEDFADLQQTSDGLYGVAGRQGTSALLVSTSGGPSGPRPADVDGNGMIYLSDAILALRILTETGTGDARADINNDQQIGLQELIYILQEVAGLR